MINQADQSSSNLEERTSFYMTRTFDAYLLFFHAKPLYPHIRYFQWIKWMYPLEYNIKIAILRAKSKNILEIFAFDLLTFYSVYFAVLLITLFVIFGIRKAENQSCSLQLFIISPPKDWKPLKGNGFLSMKEYEEKKREKKITKTNPSILKDLHTNVHQNLSD